MARSARIRQGHRWLAMLFTLLVVANLVAMMGGPPPAWVIYAPLAPLLLLMLSGLFMLAQHYADAKRARIQEG